MDHIYLMAVKVWVAKTNMVLKFKETWSRSTAPVDEVLFEIISKVWEQLPAFYALGQSERARGTLRALIVKLSIIPHGTCG